MRCKSCDAPLTLGVAIIPTEPPGVADFFDAYSEGQTLTYSENRMIDVMKCPECGWSVRVTNDAGEAAFEEPDA